MGKIIRRTVTITITESWTMVWTDDAKADDAPQPQATTIVQEQVQTQEEPDELFQAILTTAEPSDLSVNDPTVTPAARPTEENYAN
jgi:hypothetical protein